MRNGSIEINIIVTRRNNMDPSFGHTNQERTKVLKQDEEIKEWKKKIDEMSHIELA